MEEQILSSPLLTASIFTLLIVLWTWKMSRTQLRMPPGPWTLPIIGNIHQLLGSLPHHKLTVLAKKYGPVMHLKLGEVSNIIISSPEATKEVMKTHDIIFASRPALLAASIVLYDHSELAFAPYGDYWRQMRKICVLELFSAKRVRSFRPIREDEVSNLVQTISSSQGIPVNLTKMLTSFTSSISSRSISGKLHDKRDKFATIAERIKQLVVGVCIVDLFPSVPFLDVISGSRTKMEKLRAEADVLLETIINEHRTTETKAGADYKKESDNILDVLLRIQDCGDFKLPLTINNLKGIILELLITPVDTTSTVLGWAMSELLKNPTVMEKAQAELRQVFNERKRIDETNLHELKYLSLVIKETLRLHPPVPLLVPRESREEVELNGYKIPAKSRVMVNIWAMGRNPLYWDKPELFYPERFLEHEYNYDGTCFQYIPFGAGRRKCPGIQFGMAVAELALANLLYHFDWKLPEGLCPENLDMRENNGITVGRKNDLYAIATTYFPL